MKTCKYFLSAMDNVENVLCDNLEISKKNFKSQFTRLSQQIKNNGDGYDFKYELIALEDEKCYKNIHKFYSACGSVTYLEEFICKEGYFFAK